MDFQAIITAVASILGALVTLFGLYVTFKKKIKDHFARKHHRNDIIDSLPDHFEKIQNQIDSINATQDDMQEQVSDIAKHQENLETSFDTLETNALRYSINDIFFGYHNIEDVPDEMLSNAAKSCDIYLAKGLNHETGARCKVIYAEIERRQQKKAQEETKHE
jgi:predicted nuclease with TOPRIM domain